MTPYKKSKLIKTMLKKAEGNIFLIGNFACFYKDTIMKQLKTYVFEGFCHIIEGEFCSFTLAMDGFCDHLHKIHFEDVPRKIQVQEKFHSEDFQKAFSKRFKDRMQGIINFQGDVVVYEKERPEKRKRYMVYTRTTTTTEYEKKEKIKEQITKIELDYEEIEE